MEEKKSCIHVIEIHVAIVYSVRNPGTLATSDAKSLSRTVSSTIKETGTAMPQVKQPQLLQLVMDSRAMDYYLCCLVMKEGVEFNSYQS
jgi:hypothetical protein